MKIFELKKHQRHDYQKKIEVLEETAEYPLGSDYFRISHGFNYFEFFDRLGETHYFICEVDKKVVAVACAVLRKTPETVFYLCDLKVHPNFKGLHIPLKILLKGVLKYYFKCSRCYAISMNEQEQIENRVLKLLKKFWVLPFRSSAKIYIYSFSFDEIKKLTPLIESEKGKIGYLSLLGIKDLILKSTQKPLPLLHIQYGNSLEKSENCPRENHVHMISLVEGDVLIKRLLEVNILPSSSATVISHNIKNKDWSFIRTSDI